MKHLIHNDRNASMLSVHCNSLYQSTKGWLCPDYSCCNNVLISVETDFVPGNEISVFHFLLAFGSKTSEFGFSGFFNLISDLNTCIQAQVIPAKGRVVQD